MRYKAGEQLKHSGERDRAVSALIIQDMNLELMIAAREKEGGERRVERQGQKSRFEEIHGFNSHVIRRLFWAFLLLS